jgi:hypothetical protein
MKFLIPGHVGLGSSKWLSSKASAFSKSSKYVFGVDSSSDKPATMDSNSEFMRSISSSFGSFGAGVSLTLK